MQPLEASENSGCAVKKVLLVHSLLKETLSDEEDYVEGEHFTLEFVTLWPWEDFQVVDGHQVWAREVKHA